MRWYRCHARDLPWRRTSDPYAIWVSEVLLQQTQVETARSYYSRFLKTFPTVRALAAGSLDRVLKVWEGCGYYARARNLHRAARVIVRQGGELPRTAAALRTLPGIGRYTAAAIASLAFGEPVAAIDSNAERVLARLLCERRSINRAAVQRRIARTGDALLKAAVGAGHFSGVFNQALMELGATVCRPHEALCNRCPLKAECRAREKLADVTRVPRKVAPRDRPHVDVCAAVIWKRGRLLITKRPPHGMLGGLWELPGGKKRPGETLAACVAREIREELGIRVAVGARLASVRHAYSHFRITLHAFACTPLGGRVRRIGVADFKWVKPEELSAFPFPKADYKILQALSVLRNTVEP